MKNSRCVEVNTAPKKEEWTGYPKASSMKSEIAPLKQTLAMPTVGKEDPRFFRP